MESAWEACSEEQRAACVPERRKVEEGVCRGTPVGYKWFWLYNMAVKLVGNVFSVLLWRMGLRRGVHEVQLPGL